MADVIANDVGKALRPIWGTKHETATRTLQRVGKVLEWCLVHVFLDQDPAVIVKRARAKLGTVWAEAKAVKHRGAAQFADAGDCVRAIRQTKAAPITKLAFEFLVLTWARSGEVRGATWSEIDSEAKVWTIPASRMMTLRAHLVPLSDRAIEVLRMARAIATERSSRPDGLIFPALGQDAN